MDLSKLTPSEKVMAGSGIALLLFSFFPWFQAKARVLNITVTGESVSGWHYFLFGIIPVLLAIAIVAAIALTRFSTTSLPELPVPLSLAMLIAAWLAAFLVLIKLLVGEDHASRKFGIFLATLSALGLAAGAFMKYREEGGAIPGRSSGSGPSTPF